MLSAKQMQAGELLPTVYLSPTFHPPGRKGHSLSLTYRVCKRTANGGSGPHMAEGADRTVLHVQQADWEEDSFLRLNLTTLAGTVMQLHVPVSIYHTWEMQEVPGRAPCMHQSH